MPSQNLFEMLNETFFDISDPTRSELGKDVTAGSQFM